MSSINYPTIAEFNTFIAGSHQALFKFLTNPDYSEARVDMINRCPEIEGWLTHLIRLYIHSTQLQNETQRLQCLLHEMDLQQNFNMHKMTRLGAVELIRQFLRERELADQIIPTSMPTEEPPHPDQTQEEEPPTRGSPVQITIQSTPTPSPSPPPRPTRPNNLEERRYVQYPMGQVPQELHDALTEWANSGTPPEILSHIYLFPTNSLPPQPQTTPPPIPEGNPPSTTSTPPVPGAFNEQPTEINDHFDNLLNRLIQGEPHITDSNSATVASSPATTTIVPTSTPQSDEMPGIESTTNTPIQIIRRILTKNDNEFKRKSWRKQKGKRTGGHPGKHTNQVEPPTTSNIPSLLLRISSPAPEPRRNPPRRARHRRRNNKKNNNDKEDNGWGPNNQGWLDFINERKKDGTLGWYQPQELEEGEWEINDNGLGKALGWN